MVRQGPKLKYKISAQNNALIEAITNDFKIGRNVSVSRGGRSEGTLKKNRNRLRAMFYFAENKYGIRDITKINEEQILTIFEQMEKGVIKTLNKKVFTSVPSYQATFKAFWRWHIKKSRKEKGKVIANITDDFIIQKKRPEFTHFTKEQVIEMAKISRREYEVFMWFYFDSGIRPQEESKLLVEDISVDANGVVMLNIRNHIAKKGSFGRKIKLLLSGDLILDWIKDKKPQDPLFSIEHRVANQYVGRLAKQVLGKKITLYDFRHNSCCYWINIYKKDQALKYRFGWKNGDMIEYYSRYIGLNDDISENDLIGEEVRTKLEKELKQIKVKMSVKEDQERAEMQELRESITKEVLKALLNKDMLRELLAEAQSK
jgi:integrase